MIPSSINVLLQHLLPPNNPDIPNLRIYGHEIPFVDSVRYLGVILDKKLLWNKHIDLKIRNAKFSLIRARNALGTLWGPNPRLAKWLYTGIICPAITYAAMIWGRATSTSLFKLKAQKLQRLALLTISPVRVHSPSEALQVVSFVPPLELLIESIGVSTYRRIKYLLDLSQALPGMWQRKSHIKWAQFIELEYGLSDIPSDVIPVEISWKKTWEIDLQGFDPIADSNLNTTYVYTDGSKLGGRAGSGVVVTQADSQGRHVPVLTLVEGLGASASVFQAELNAIIISIIEILKISEPTQENLDKFGHISGNPICFVSDSKACIQAIDSHIVKSEMVSRCKGLLLKLSDRCPVSIKWIKAHAGHAGNELADAKAKAGARLEVFGPEPIIPASKCWFKSKIKHEMCAKWSWKWLSSPTCRQTKIFFKSPCKIKAKQLLQSGREKFGRAFRWLSGHNFLRRHNNLIDSVKYPSSKCRLCDLDEETSSHVIMFCEALGQLRLKVFGKHFLTELDNWKVGELLTFLDYPRVARLEEFPH